MARKQFESVDDYLASQPKAAREALARVRRSIRKAVPGTDETVSYGMPAYKLRGKLVLYFAGWSRHYSLYPASDRILTAFESELAPYEIERRTIRFPFSKPVPARLIERIAKLRAKEVGEREKAKD
jgi:uncharacterized protein YdhG (YjbR/CyaY superfamily)